MKEKIGLNSGLIWEYLDSKGSASLKDIRKDCKLTERDTFAALGWLAREGKIAFKELKNHCEVALV